MDGNLTIAAASAIQQSRTANEVSMAVAQKAQQAQAEQGHAVVNLVKQVEQLTSQLAQGKIDVEL